jgi:hypothetical protein
MRAGDPVSVAPELQLGNRGQVSADGDGSMRFAKSRRIMPCIRSIIDMHEAMGLLHGGWWTNVIPYRP